MRRLSLFLAATLFVPRALAEPSSPRHEPLDAAATLTDLSLARNALESLHAGYDRYTERSELDGLWSDLETAAAQGMTRGELYLGLSRVLATIRCDHTKAELSKDMEQAREIEPIYLPFRYRFFDRRMWVIEVPAGVDLTPGDEILTIDDRSVATLINEVGALYPVDGDTDHVKAPSLSEFGEFMGPAFDHFMPFLHAIDATAALEVRRASGVMERLAIQRLPFPDFAAITGERRFSHNFADAIRFETLGDDAAYLAIDTFINYRKPIRPNTIYRPIFAQLARENRSKLIVDLRRNGGGSDDAAWGLLEWLIREPIQPIDAVWTRFDRISETLRPHLDTWEKKALSPDPNWFEAIGDGYFRVVAKKAGAPSKRLKPRRRAFDGELIVLTGSGNASGVTHLLATLRAARRATFVGAPTGGAATGATAGIIVFMTLPNSGIKIRIPLQRTVMAHADALDPRGGIEPDIEALDTKESFFAGTDPALEAALRAFDVKAQ